MTLASDPALYQQDSWRPLFEALRQNDPVHYCPDSPVGPYWSISTYDLIHKVELDTKTYSSRADLGGIQIQDIAPELDRPSFVSMDPPDHTGRRKAVQPMTNRSSLNGLSDLIRERTGAVLEALPRGETFDWVDRVSTELTGRMLATMFDFPQEEHRRLIYWSDVAVANIGAVDAPVKTEAERYEILEEMAAAFLPYWQERKGVEGGFDLISMLANSDATKDMDHEEWIGTLFLLIVGGNDTTRNSMSGGLIALQENPEQWEMLSQKPDLIPNMVAEMIRWQTPVIHMRRSVLTDTELAGHEIKAGDKVAMWYISGNCDESVFPDPYAFKVDRENARRHLSFGAGVHRCVGDRLAELQLKILWEEIVGRDMAFEITGDPVRVYSNFIRGFQNLPVKIIKN